MNTETFVLLLHTADTNTDCTAQALGLYTATCSELYKYKKFMR